MAITKGEYLAALQAEVEATGQKRKKTAKRKRVVALVLGIGTVFLLGAGSIGTRIERATNFNRFSAGEIGASFEMLGEDGVFEVWNEQNLGSDINTLLGGGKLYARNGLTVLPVEDGYSVAKDNQVIGHIPGSISYINVAADRIFYRDDATRGICTFSIQNGSITTVIDSGAGELLLSDGKLYYVDRQNGSKLSVASLDGLDRQTAIDQSVVSFAVCGDDVIFLGPDQTLYRKDIAATSATTLMPNIERFFICENIIAESGDSIFCFTAEKSNASLLYQSSAEDMQLVGACADGVFVQEGGELRFIDGSSTATVATDAPVLYQSISLDDAETVRYIALSSMTEAHLGEAHLPDLKGGN